MSSAGRRLLRASSDTQWTLVAQDNSAGVLTIPTAAIGVTTSGATAHLDGSGSFSTLGPIVAWSWALGDGSTSTAPAVDHTYQSAGQYTVSLTVTDSTGAAGARSVPVTVGSNVGSTVPTARLTGVAAGQLVTFDASGSTSPTGAIGSYRWSFGDGSNSVTTTTPGTSHTYAVPGAYTATVTVTDVAGVTASASVTVSPSVPAPVSGDLGGNGSQQLGANIVLAQGLTGSDFSKLVNAAGAANSISLQAKSYTFSDFAYGTQTIANGAGAYGAQITTCAGILGPGSNYASISMLPRTSTKAGDVPPRGSYPATNQLQYLLIANLAKFRIDGVQVLGTEQGHTYNGVMLQAITALTVSNTTVKHIPGDDYAPPGETFSMNIYKTAASSVTTLTNVTFDGDGVAAVGLGTNSTNGAITATNLYVKNTAASAAWASWQQNGTVTTRNFVTENCIRSYNAERHGGVSNHYDPIWCQPAAGRYDVNYTWTTGYSGGAINFYFTDAAAWQRYIAARTTKKITMVVASNGLGNLIGSVSVYVAGVKQVTTDYVAFTGS